MSRKRLHQDDSAEREAIDVGKKFMNSSDVVGDMSRQYGADLSSVRIHHDADSAARAQQRGVDAFSTGTDVFFGRGAFNQSDPASRGLLAHELSHSLQQGVGGGQGSMEQSAPMGAEQGGLISWFKRKIAAHRAKKQAKKAAGMEEPGELPLYQQPTKREYKDVERFMLPNGDEQRTGRPELAGLDGAIKENMGVDEDGTPMFEKLGSVHNSAGDEIHGLNAARSISLFKGGELGEDLNQEQLMELVDKMTATRGVTAKRPASSFQPEELQNMDERYYSGMSQYKDLLYGKLKYLEGKYGAMASQMHPADLIQRLDKSWYTDIATLQDCGQISGSKDKRIFNTRNRKDREFDRLSRYFDALLSEVVNFAGYSEKPMNDYELTSNPKFRDRVNASEKNLRQASKKIGGPRMSRREEKNYLKDLRKRMKESGHAQGLFGRFA